MNFLIKRLCACFVLAVTIGCLSACQSNWYPESDFGSTVNGAVMAQAKNPNAPKGNPKLTTGLDGPAAKSSVDSYQKTFERKPVTPQATSGSMIGSSIGITVQ